MLALIKQERWARLDFNLPLHVKAISMKYFFSSLDRHSFIEK